MKRKLFIQKTALLLVGGIFLLSYVNKAVFTHSHVLPDGRVIVHAHPYFKHKEEKNHKNFPIHSHHHTPNQYYLLSLHHIYYSSFHFFHISAQRFSQKIFFIRTPFIVESGTFCNFRIRPPPLTPYF